MTARRRCRPLPRDLKKAVHAPPESNAGAGWWPKGWGCAQVEPDPDPELDVCDFIRQQNEKWAGRTRS